MIPEGNVLVVYLTRTSANRKKGVEKFTYDDLMGELEQRGTKVLRVWNVGKTKQQVLDEILAGVCPQVFPQEKLKVLAVLAKEKGEGDKK